MQTWCIVGLAISLAWAAGEVKNALLLLEDITVFPENSEGAT